VQSIYKTNKKREKITFLQKKMRIVGILCRKRDIFRNFAVKFGKSVNQ